MEFLETTPSTFYHKFSDRRGILTALLNIEGKSVSSIMGRDVKIFFTTL